MLLMAHFLSQDKVVLMGHSAGAHLAVMAVLELLHDEWVHGIRIEPPPSDSMELDEQYFDGSNGENDTKPASSEGSSASFDVLNGNSNGDAKGNGVSVEGSSSSFVLLGQEESGRSQRELGRIDSETSDSIEVLDVENLTESDSEEWRISSGERTPGDSEEDGEEDEEDDMSNKDEEDSVITVRPRVIDRQPTLMDLGKCVRGIIGKLFVQV